MPKRKRPSLFVAADVFGVTPELREFVKKLADDAIILSPHRDGASFRVEAEGYAQFMEQGGVEAYAARLAQTISAQTKVFDLALGFSAGATALWLCLADQRLAYNLPRHAILYYGSRIREHAQLRPLRPARLVFAQREASFDPLPLAETLRKSCVEAEVIPGSAHGFMNPLSPGFDAALYANELQKIRRNIR